MAKKPTTAAKAAPASVAPIASAAAPAAAAPADAVPGTPAVAAPADDEARAAFTADLRARLAAQLEELAAERGITPEEIIAFARELLGGSAENIAVLQQDVAAAAASTEVPEGMELITVIGPAAGLRRAGHQFNAVPNTIVVTAEQKALITADPALSVIDDASAEAQFAARQGEKPAVTAFAFDPNGFTDVKVLGPKAGRRRIGHSFGPEESIVRVDARELEELLADNLLAVGQA